MDVREWYENCNEHIETQLGDYIEKFFGVVSSPFGNMHRVNPCAKCGHHDCLTFSKGLVWCFSCGFKGNYVSAYLDFAVENKNKSRLQAIKEIEEFCSLSYPLTFTPDEREAFEQRERLFEIRRLAVDFYARQLKSVDKKFKHKDRDYTPLDYLKVVRGHSEETLDAFLVGFSQNFKVLSNLLEADGYTEIEMKAAKIWIPAGLFVYPQWDPVTKHILRINTKNPFEMTMKSKRDPKIDELIQGFSIGDKVNGFSPSFSFKKRIIFVEGENDAQSVYGSSPSADDIGKNVTWLSGNPNDEAQFAIFVNRKTKGNPLEIYLMMDNDEKGDEYVRRVNGAVPNARVFQISYDKNYNDPDEYFKKCPNPKSMATLMEEAEELKTDKFIIRKDRQTWTIENRNKRLVFEMDYIDDRKNAIVGNVKLYGIGEDLKDMKTNISLTKLTNGFKPFSLYLNEKIESYYNTSDDINDKTLDDLYEMFRFSKYKTEITKAFAYKALNSEGIMEDVIVWLRERIGQDAVDEVLKEINDIQNQCSIAKLTDTTPPEMKLSHFFSTINGDAYFYFIASQYDGETIRKIPYLLRNDGGMIRLDLLKRKSEQCILLIDNKYEFPEEMPRARMNMRECSLTFKWAEMFGRGEVADYEISPFTLIKTIENYIRMFYFHTDENVYKIVALYIFGTYFYEMFGQYPYLFLNGEKGSGKTILDIVIQLFALNARHAVNISEAALYRMISFEGGTLILDEMENLTSRAKTQDSLMATLLKGGYQKSGKAYRYNTDTETAEGFDVFCPKVISNIYGIEDVIEDRCIRIDTYRMKVKKGNQLEDPKRYLNDKLDTVREYTSKCCLSALTHFQKLNAIYDGSLMITGNARLTQLLTPILAVARLADLAKDDPSLASYDLKNMDIDAITGEYSSAFQAYYESNILVAKNEIESLTPEGLLKSILHKVAQELSQQDMLEDMHNEYIDNKNHKYKNRIEYNEATGDFTIDCLHIKVFMEETFAGWNVSLSQIHKHMKSILRSEKPGRRKEVRLEGSSEELINEFKGNTKLKLQHYDLNVKDFVSSANRFMKEDHVTVDKEISSPF